MTFTARLLAFAAAPHALPPATRAATVRLLEDTLAVGCAGSSDPAAAQLFRAFGSPGGSPEARLLGRQEKLSAPAAAAINGFHIHCLEWDAVHEPAVVHALSVVTAALIAVIDRAGGTDPEDALAALAVGVDIAAGLGLCVTTPMRFFRPATAGVIGAALACARLADLPPDRFADVLGLAYSQCAGTMQAHLEGSVALPLQIALAARAAVTAVDCVGAGLTGPHDALEGPYGYFRLIEFGDLARYFPSPGPAFGAATLSPQGEGTREQQPTYPLSPRGEGQAAQPPGRGQWLIEQVSTKPYPSGRASHAALAALAARPAARTLHAHVPSLINRLIARPWVPDMTPAYARLCLPFLVALMARDGRIDPHAFTPATFADKALRHRITVTIEQDSNPDPNALSPQRLVVDGEELTVQHTLGSPAAPLSEAERAAKLAQCYAIAHNAAAAAQIAQDPLAWFCRGPA